MASDGPPPRGPWQSNPSSHGWSSNNMPPSGPLSFSSGPTGNGSAMGGVGVSSAGRSSPFHNRANSQHQAPPVPLRAGSPPESQGGGSSVQQRSTSPPPTTSYQQSYEDIWSQHSSAAAEGGDLPTSGSGARGGGGGGGGGGSSRSSNKKTAGMSGRTWFLLLGALVGCGTIVWVLRFTLSRPAQSASPLAKLLSPSMQMASFRDPSLFSSATLLDPCTSERVLAFKKRHRDSSIYGDDWSFWTQEQQSSFAMLARAQQALDGANVPFWLTGSTLLGWYRECGMLERQTSLDVALFRPQQNPFKIVELLVDQANFTFVKGCGCERGCGCSRCRCDPAHSSRPGLQYSFEWTDTRHSRSVAVKLRVYLVERAAPRQAPILGRDQNSELEDGVGDVAEEEAEEAEEEIPSAAAGEPESGRSVVGEVWEPMWDGDERLLHCVYSTGQFVPGQFGKLRFWVPADSEHYLSRRYGSGWAKEATKRPHATQGALPLNCFWPQHLAQHGNATRVYEAAVEALRHNDQELAVTLFKQRGFMKLDTLEATGAEGGGRSRRRGGRRGLWEEETFYSLLQAGTLIGKLQGPSHEMVSLLLASFERRSTRAEPLYLIARHYRSVKQYRLCYLFAKQATSIRFPDKDWLMTDANKGVYLYQVLDEFGVCAYYVGRYQESLEAGEEVLRVASRAGLTHQTVKRVQQNLNYARRKLGAARTGARLALASRPTGTTIDQEGGASREDGSHIEGGGGA